MKQASAQTARRPSNSPPYFEAPPDMEARRITSLFRLLPSLHPIPCYRRKKEIFGLSFGSWQIICLID